MQDVRDDATAIEILSNDSFNRNRNQQLDQLIRIGSPSEMIRNKIVRMSGIDGHWYMQGMQ